MLRGNWSNRITAAIESRAVPRKASGTFSRSVSHRSWKRSRIRASRAGSGFHHCSGGEAEPEIENLVPPGHQAAVPPTVRPSISKVGWPTPAGTDWPPLPQMPTPSSSAMSLPIAGDLGEHGRAVADQGRALERRAEPAVLDPIGLGAGEDELAAGDVDLAAAEALGVDAVAGAGEDLAGILLAAEHEGVGHPRHRRMGEALAAAVAGRLDPHQPGVEPVVDIALEDSVLDQGGALGRRALVVDRQRARGDRAIEPSSTTVTPGAATRSPIRPEKAEVPLRLKSPSRPWPIASWSKHSGPAGPEHDRHLAGRRGDRFEIHQRLRERDVDRPVPDRLIEQICRRDSGRRGRDSRSRDGRSARRRSGR